jgi:hypothetical protein
LKKPLATFFGGCDQSKRQHGRPPMPGRIDFGSFQGELSSQQARYQAALDIFELVLRSHFSASEFTRGTQGSVMLQL